MSAPQHTDDHTAIVEKLAHAFYKVVPENYKTYCAFTSQVLEQVLNHFGVPCQRVPCQVWYTEPQKINVIGFLGQSNHGKWDGHIVCCTNQLLIDTALHHFEREFGAKAPWVAVARLFEFPSTAIAHLPLDASNSIWWHHPPEGAMVTPPQEPQDLVDQYAGALIQTLSPT